MSQQQHQQPQTGQHAQTAQSQWTGGTFDQYVPQTVSQAVYQLEQLETDAEWAHGQAMQMGDRTAAKKLADIEDIVHLQKKLLLRESEMAQTVGQCTQQALYQCSQGLQGSQTPGVQSVVQQTQQVAQRISQASQQATMGAQQGQQSHMGGQFSSQF